MPPHSSIGLFTQDHADAARWRPFLPLAFLYPPSPPLRSHSPPNMTAMDPPSSDSEPDIEHEEYEYESEGEQLLANSARTLLKLAEGNHRCKLIARIYELY